MKAKVTKSFVGRRDDATVSETFKEGDIVEGELATVAVGLKTAEEIKPRDAAKIDKAQTKLDAVRQAHADAVAAHDAAAGDAKAAEQKKVDAAKKALDDAEADLAKLTD